jgi:UDP-glucuronate 4-epimerase
MHFIGCIEKALGVTAKKVYLPLQPGDVERTFADVDALAEAVGFRPSTPIEEGIRRFTEWYRSFYQV